MTKGGAGKRRVTLDPTEETLLIPLYGRAQLTRQGHPLIHDPKAVAMVEAIDYDFARFDGKASLVGAVWRTRIHDHWVRRWLDQHPAGTVVEVGAGLNTRFERIDNGRLRWFDLDLPAPMALRRRFFADTDRRTTIAASVADAGWVEEVAATGGPWFFVAEAVLGFLPQVDVRRALSNVAGFPRARASFDTWTSWMAAHQDEHDVLGDMEARLRWFCDNVFEVETWGLGLRLLESLTFTDGPAEVLALLPPELTEAIPSFVDDPQNTSYRQNLVEADGPARG